MNTLIFLAGVGVGCLVAFGFFAGIVIWVVRKNNPPGDSKKSLTLMEERNKLDAQKAQYLKTVADWCDNNWNSLQR